MKKTRNHFSLLCGIGDLLDLMSGSPNIESFLQDAANMVARHLNAEVCSIYLYDELSDALVLTATIGLNPGSVGRVRMKPGEGLVGATFQDIKPMREAHASKNPNFKHFEETDEDRFESFLSVPIQRGIQKIGVIVVQHELGDFFDRSDLMALRASASQLAAAIENARLLITVSGQDDETAPALPAGYGMFRGNPAAGGYALAESTVFKRSHSRLLHAPPDDRGAWSPDDFHDAVRKTEDQLKDYQERLAERQAPASKRNPPLRDDRDEPDAGPTGSSVGESL